MPFSRKQKLLLGIIGGVLFSLVIAEGYVIVDQAVTISYMKVGYEATEDELALITAIINTTDLSKSQIEQCLKNSSTFEDIEVAGDTVQLWQHKLIFRNNRLLKIIPI